MSLRFRVCSCSSCCSNPLLLPLAFAVRHISARSCLRGFFRRGDEERDHDFQGGVKTGGLPGGIGTAAAELLLQFAEEFVKHLRQSRGVASKRSRSTHVRMTSGIFQPPNLFYPFRGRGRSQWFLHRQAAIAAQTLQNRKRQTASENPPVRYHLSDSRRVYQGQRQYPNLPQ